MHGRFIDEIASVVPIALKSLQCPSCEKLKINEKINKIITIETMYAKWHFFN